MRLTDRGLAGLLFFLGATEFLIAMMAGEATQPGYSVGTNAISDLGVGTTALLFNASVIFVGAMGLLGAYFLLRAYHRRPLTVLLALAGIGAIGVGLFPETTLPTHTIFAFVAFFFGGLAAIVAFPIEPWPINVLSVLLGVVGLGALVLFTARTYLALGFGGMERMIVYPILLWEVLFGGYLMGSAEPEGGASSA